MEYNAIMWNLEHDIIICCIDGNQVLIGNNKMLLVQK